MNNVREIHDDVIKWKTFSTLLAICVGNSLITGKFPAQRPVTRSFDVFFICAWINGWVNNGEAGDLRHHRTHYDVTVMSTEVNAASSSCGGKQYVDERTEVNETRHTINTTDIYRMCWNILGKYPFLRDAIIHVCEATGLWSISTQKSIA